MARIYPFRALRYDTSCVSMEDVVTQPYDKITPAMQERYYEASPYNLIRVILGKHEPNDTDDSNCYTRAADTLRAWRKNHILAEEAEPALYGYSQTYTVPHTNEVRERRGFIALGHLYDYADKVVYRHEQTFPKHKSDRMSLFKATRAYCEQIYMLYSDPAFTAEKLIFGNDGTKVGDAAPADLAITDEYGVIHKVWKLTDPSLINLIVTAMADKKLIIADGHHRYETSVAYAKERSAQLKLPLNQPRDEDEKLSPSRLPVPSFPEAAMMMTFVNMNAPGITILPTHRVVFGMPVFSGKKFVEVAAPFFSAQEIPATDAALLLKRLSDTDGVAIVAATKEGNFLLRAKPDAINAALSELSPHQRGLDVVQLHKIVLEKILLLNEETVRAGSNVRYLREAPEALVQVVTGDADVAFLIKPVTLKQMEDVSMNLEVMPQKSTDFYPKLLSGLAMYTLD